MTSRVHVCGARLPRAIAAGPRRARALPTKSPQNPNCCSFFNFAQPNRCARGGTTRALGCPNRTLVPKREQPATNGLDHFGPGRQAALLRQPVAARARAAADGRRRRVRVAKSAGLRGLPRALHGRGRRRGRARGRGRRARRACRRGRGAEPVRARRDAGRAGDGAGVGRRPSRVRRLPPAGSAARRRRRGDGNPLRGRRRARPRDFDRDPGRPRPPRRHGGARRGAILDPGRRLAAAERLRRRRGRGRGGGGRDRRERRRPGPRRGRPPRRPV